MTNNRDFLKTRVSYGLILRANLETIEELKRIIAERPGIEIIYQLIEAGRLWIIRDNERGNPR